MDIAEYIESNDILSIITLNYENPEFINSIIEEIYKNICDGYLLLDPVKYSNKNDIITAHFYSIKINITNYVYNYINKYKKYKSNLEKLNNLQKIILPKQRSVEWFEMRKGVLTASSLAAALGDDYFKPIDVLILSKIEPEKPFETNPITEWGVKYEDIATKFYESLNNIKIIEFGMIPHPKFPIFGASPDGICGDGSIELTGRMLEIKCPPKRKFTKTVPKPYWIQMQGQMECCDLDTCDFFQVKLNDYDSFEDYEKDHTVNNEPGKTKHELPKGVTVTYSEMFSDKYIYFYPILYQTNEYYKTWVEDKKTWIKDNNFEFVEAKWWMIERYECTLVHRDKGWWNDQMAKIIEFWEKVEYYKKNGTSELIQRINEKKGKKRVTVINLANTKECLIK